MKHLGFAIVFGGLSLLVAMSAPGKSLHLFGAKGSGRGDLQCILSPDDAILKGARWSVVGEDGDYASETIINLPLRSEGYTITFSKATGYVSPANVNVKLLEDGQKTVTAEYTK